MQQNRNKQKNSRQKADTPREGDSQVFWFAGNYEDYEEDRKRRLGEDAANPRRIKYKPLVRG